MPDLVRVAYTGAGKTMTPNEMGMRPMQARVYEARAAQFITRATPGRNGTGPASLAANSF